MEIYDNYLKLFTDYITTNYDMNNPLIKLKYYHTLRVCKIMLEIGNKLRLDESNLLIAYLIGLFHDLGRFREVVRLQKFNNLAFDHGAYSNKILYNDHLIDSFNIDKNLDLLIRKALYFHNKKDIEGDMTEKELFYSKLIRDADKIDIINIIGNGKRLLFNAMPTQEVLEKYQNKESIDLKSLKNKSDRVILYFGFIKNLYFKESEEVLNNYPYIEKLLQNIDVDFEYKDQYFNIVNNLIRREGEKVYVR